MPYSLKQQLEHKKKMWVKANTKPFVEAAKEAASRTLEEICQAGATMFDQCIDQFYMYETQSYYRHETGRGTGTGWNLYLANSFQKIYHDGYVVSFVSGWDSNGMAPYKSSISKQYVLDNVMSGVRGVEDKYMKYAYKSYDNHWSATIQSPLFGNLSGTPKEIFEAFDNKWRDVAISLNRKYRREAFSKIEIRW